MCPPWANEEHLVERLFTKVRVGFWGNQQRVLQGLRESWRIGELMIVAVQVSLLGREQGVNKNTWYKLLVRQASHLSFSNRKVVTTLSTPVLRVK